MTECVGEWIRKDRKQSMGQKQHVTLLVSTLFLHAFLRGRERAIKRERDALRIRSRLGKGTMQDPRKDKKCAFVECVFAPGELCGRSKGVSAAQMKQCRHSTGFLTAGSPLEMGGGSRGTVSYLNCFQLCWRWKWKMGRGCCPMKDDMAVGCERVYVKEVRIVR